MTIVLALIYVAIGLSLSVYTVREINKRGGDGSDRWVGFVSLVTGVLWPIEAGLFICGLFGKLGKDD